ncbi:hypothetical protein HCZ30_12830 [Marivivens donghaensis]|uniref:Uncharacterized protein n=1 Tax=Marivivens donghaensis TaxID=1699413 RepID=A0ABX0VYY8_9RHOB|nr:hypothetical protein [Marivivens donghaensis]NIY73312.1 hypothetical protein [Marivivens donghaensis]
MRWLWLCLALWGTSANADTLPVWSGEHGAFTRLVIPIGAREWDLVNRGADYELTIIGSDFDTRQIYTRIDRTRLAAVSGEDTLRLTLGCHCQAFADTEDGNLIIDIRESAVITLPIVAERPPAPLELPPMQQQIFAANIARAASAAFIDPLTNLKSDTNSAGITYQDALGTRTDPYADRTGCLPDGALDVATWGTGEFQADVENAISHMAEGFDSLNDEAREALARTYLYYGLAEEAESLATSPATRVIITALLTSHSSLTTQSSCGDDAHLWAAASGAQISDAAAIQRAFRSLSSDLRNALSDRLTASLIDVQDLSAAAAIIAMTPEPTKLARARLALGLGDLSGAKSLLLAALDSDQAGEAFDLFFAVKPQISASDFEALAAYAFTIRRTPEYTEKISQLAELASQSGLYAQAFSVASSAALPEVVRALVDTANDAEFLTVALTLKDLPPRLQSIVDERLHRMGFAAANEL